MRTSTIFLVFWMFAADKYNILGKGNGQTSHSTNPSNEDELDVMELREDHLANIAINEKIWKLDAEKRTTEYGSKNDSFGYWRMDK